MIVRIIILCLALLTTPAYAGENIFIIGSYQKEDLCGDPQLKGVNLAIEESGLHDTSVTSFFLHSRIISKQDFAQKVQSIEQEIERKKPRVIITLDDPAFNAFAKTVLANPAMYLVFSGVNRSLTDYNKELDFLNDTTPTKNITGVHEKLFMLEQMEFFEMLLNKLDKVAILYSTDSMGMIIKDQIVNELKQTIYASRLEFFPVKYMQDLYAAADEINDRKNINAYLPLPLSIIDKSTGQKKTVEELAPLLIEKIHKPDLALNKAFSKVGFLGGVSVDFHHMGHQAGTLAIKLLHGYNITKLKTENAGRHTISLNKKRQGSLSLTIRDDIWNLLDEVY
ncbi:hypothetical protein JYT30_00270 [Desulfotalea psychrophila]|uniref:Leucine-binding protein domain-containing protein n=1 Tax=Desulfotalea psychrophila TaxID=84980 RepID=A0ABS3AT71_9BACT|nr:hypothetical protein [Desulfocapsa sp.]MBN4068309.1 hypothetical protein [Desulfotalea psychrophila]MBN4071576.1 hypothetical protein [Desulfotalea psychrophila]